MLIEHVINDAREFSEACHTAAAKWWVDLKTGQPLDRNVAEMLCLIHSEISEAWDALKHNSYDDHLPDRLGIEVELGDALIRLGDLMRGLSLTDEWSIKVKEIGKAPILQPTRSAPGRLMEIHLAVDNAMESHRKDKTKMFVYYMAEAYVLLHDFSDFMNLDIRGAIHEKMQYNARREDHKLENRKKDGGKNY